MLADRTLAFVLAQGFPAVWGPDSAERGLPISVEALELCERTRDAELAMQVRLWRISLLLELDDPGRAEKEIEAYGETARRLGQPRTLVFDPLHRALMANMRGEFDEAERLTAEAIERSDEVHGSMSRLVADGQRFLQRRVRGRHLDAEPFLRQHAESVPLMRRWRCMLARRDRRERSPRRGAQGARPACRRGLPGLPARRAVAARDVAAGASSARWSATRAGRALLYDLLAPFEGRNVISLGAAYIGPVARYLGLLAMTTGEVERALGHLETARSATQRSGALPMEVLTALDTAEVLARRGSPGDAERGTALVQSVATRGGAPRDGRRGRARRGPARAARDSVRRRARRARARKRLGSSARTTCGCSPTAGAACTCRTPRACASSPRCSRARARRSRPRCSRRRSRDRTAAAARAAQRARAAELSEEIAEARAFNDPERLARASAELERLADRLEGDASSGAGERARINVTRAIRAALRRIEIARARARSPASTLDQDGIVMHVST